MIIRFAKLAPSLMGPLALLLLTGCGEPDIVCQSGGSVGSTISRDLLDRRSGTLVLEPGSQSVTRSYRATARGLSSIGVERPRSGPSASSSHQLSYAEEPEAVEFPHVTQEVRIRGASASVGPGDFVDAESCDALDTPCCAAGNVECSFVIDVTFSRTDALFPAVTVSFDVTSVVTIPDCSPSTAQLTLQEIDPQ